jgi:hypothetical protein
MSSEAKEELYREMKEDSYVERMTREDLEFALESTDFVKAIVMLENVQKALASYGHEYTLKELVEMW